MKNEFLVEKNIPIPTGKGRRCKYPVGGMEVGDSFFVDKEVKSRNQLEVKRALSSVYQYCKSIGIKRGFTSRLEGGGFRIWRTK